MWETTEDSAMLGEANLIDYSLITGLLVYALAPCNGKGQPSRGTYRLTLHLWVAPLFAMDPTTPRFA